MIPTIDKENLRLTFPILRDDTLWSILFEWIINPYWDARFYELWSNGMRIENLGIGSTGSCDLSS